LSKVGRLINAIGFGNVFLCCPVWIGENVRPEVRGFFLCVINGSIVFGQFLLSLCAYGTQQIDGHWSYMSLIVLQFAFVLVLAVGWPFYPESPYWLLKTGKSDKARKALGRMHGSSRTTLIEAEMVRIAEEVRVSEEMKALARQGGPPILQCFQGTNLRRTLISCLPAAAQQLIGAAFVLGEYLPR
jgi:MFS family permease